MSKEIQGWPGLTLAGGAGVVEGVAEWAGEGSRAPNNLFNRLNMFEGFPVGYREQVSQSTSSSHFLTEGTLWTALSALSNTLRLLHFLESVIPCGHSSFLPGPAPDEISHPPIPAWPADAVHERVWFKQVNLQLLHISYIIFILYEGTAYC